MKKKLTKRILSLILAVMMVFGNVPDMAITTYAAEMQDSENPEGENHAPELSADAPNMVELTVGDSYDVTQYFTDSDGDALTFNVDCDDVVLDTGVSAYDYVPTEAGRFLVSVEATDGQESAWWSVAMIVAEAEVPDKTEVPDDANVDSDDFQNGDSEDIPDEEAPNLDENDFVSLSDGETDSQTEFDISNGSVNITEDGEYTVTGTTTSNSIKVADGVTATITLDNVSIKFSDGNIDSNETDMTDFGTAAIVLGEGANVTLKLEGENTLESGKGRAGIEVPGKYVHKNGTKTECTPASLTIEGSGSLTVNTDSLAAAIGASFLMNAGNITIKGGTITAKNTSNAAAIGGSHAGDGVGTIYGSFGNITINGGIVNATGANTAAGIGNGCHGSNDADAVININGGIVTANGGSHSGQPDDIGMGYRSGTYVAPTVNIGGNAIVIADRINKKGNGAVNHTGGIIVNGSTATMVGSVELSEDYTLPSGTTLTVPAGENLTILSGKTLTVDGTIQGEGSVMVKGGTVENEENISCTFVKGDYYLDLNVSPESQTYNQEITLTVEVKKSADDSVASEMTGTVTFICGESELGTAELAEGIAILKTAVTLAAGTHKIKAEWSYNDTVNTDVTTVTVVKADQDKAPAAPASAVETTSTSVTVKAVTDEGQGSVEYGYAVKPAEGETAEPANWQSETAFSNLKPNTTYLFYSRFAGNEYYNPIVSASGLEVTTVALPKMTAPVLSDTPVSNNLFAIELTAPEACKEITDAIIQYSMSSDDGATWGDWQTSSKFSNLSEGKEYQFRARYAVTEYEHYSDASNVIKATATGIVLDENNHDIPINDSITDSYQMRFTNINISGVKVVKHSYNEDTAKAVVILDKDTDKTVPITFVMDCVAGTFKSISYCTVTASNTYNTVGNMYPVDGSTAEGKWVHTYQVDESNVKGQPQKYFMWDENGEATFSFTSKSFDNSRYNKTYTVELRIASGENGAPVLRDGVEESVSATLELGESYSVRLGEIFEDPDLDEMTYTVSVNDAEPVTANSVYYTYTPDTEGETTLVFKAKDSNGNESAPYTVKVGAYELTSIATGATSGAVWNPNIASISIGKAKVLKVIKPEFDDQLAWVLLDKDTDTTEELFLKLNVLTTANHFDAMQINDNNVDGTYELSADFMWYGTYAPTWENNTATLKFCAKFRNSGSNTYTILLKIADADNQAPALTEGNENGNGTASVTQYDKHTVDVESLFSDSDDTRLRYFVSVNGGAETEIGESYTYIPKTEGEHTLKFTAKDLQDASAEYTLTINASAYTFPENVYQINNAAEEGALLYMEVLNSDDEKIEDVTYTSEEGEDGTHIIHVTLPGKLVSNATVKAKFGIVQNEDGVPFCSSDNRYIWASRYKGDTFTANLSGGKGTTDVYWYESTPTSNEDNEYEIYRISYTIDRKDNQAPVFAEGISANVTAEIDQYNKWTYDLSKIFTDPEGDEITYTVTAPGEEAKTTNSSYSYQADTCGNKTFYFTATDGFGAESATHKVTLTVNFVPNLTVETGDGNGTETGRGITKIHIRGQEVLMSNYTKNDDTTRTIAVQLAGDVENDAQVNILTEQDFQVGVEMSPSSPVTLAEGKAEVTVKTKEKVWISPVTPITYHIYLTKEANNPPALAEGVDAEFSAEKIIGESYSINLNEIFADADGHNLAYKVSINEAEAADAEAEYIFTPEMTGTYVLKFTAYDLWGAGASHTVTLKVTNSSVTYEVPVKVPEDVTPAFYATAGYDDENQDKLGDQLEAVKGESADGFTLYTVKVPENISQISFRGTDEKGVAWGGMSFATEKDMKPTILRQVQAVITSKIDQYGTTVTPTADQVQFRMKYGEGRYAVSGSSFTDTFGYLGYRFFTLAKDNELVYTYYTVPLGALADVYATNTGETKTVTTDSAEIVTTTLPLALKSSVSVPAPSDAEVEMYYQAGNYNYVDVPAFKNVDNGDGTKTVTFSKSNGNTHVYRVTKEGKITKAGYCTPNVTEFTVDWDHDDRAENYRGIYDGSTIMGSRGDDSIYVNVNYRNNLVLDTEETHKLRAYRVWQIINSDTMNKMIEPDFNYEILSGSDVISVTNTEGSSCNEKNSRLDIKGLKEGVAVLEVGYDAIHVLTMEANGSAVGDSGENVTYNAIDPDRTALIVAQVGNHAEDVVFNIQRDSTYAWDAEHDTVYFTGDKGQIKLAPTVESGSISKVELSTDKGSSYVQLEADENGVYTADIVAGNNIICVTKADGTKSYQVIRGDKVTYTVTEVKGYSDQDGIIEAGERITVQLHGCHNVNAKMAGIYNPNFYATHFTFNEEEVTQGTGQYNYPTSVYVTVQIPGAAGEGDTYQLTNGYTTVGGWGGSSGAHRDATGEVPPNMDASEVTAAARNIFPEITLTVGEETTKIETVEVESISLTLTETEVKAGSNISLAATVLPANATDKTVTWTTSNSTIATVENGVVTGVKEGEATITAQAGEKTATCKVTVTKAETENPGLDLDFGLTEEEILGYVTVSFEDKGVRVDGESMDEMYRNPLGTIIEPTKVPFKAYDTIAAVTLRLLDAKGITATHNGTINSAFYLSSIDNFTVNGTKYSSFGEFDAGQGSGWMITWNKGGTDKDWFINKGASEFYVTDNDIIKWKYTCQLGADIGDHYSSEQVENVEKLIDKIGTVTKDSKDAIEAARKAYEELTDLLKKAVDNYETLEAAEKAYAELTATNADRTAAQKVEELISAIGSVTLDSEQKIKEARTAYDALTENQKLLVENYADLVKAENILSALKNPSHEEVYKETGNYLAALGTPSVGSVGGEWMALGLARSGRTVPSGYYDNVVAYVKENIDDNGRLHASKSTDNSRVILALTAAGYDPRNVSGYNLLNGLTDLDYVKKQGINGPIWALIALDSHNYAIPSSDVKNPVTRNSLVDTILAAQLSDNGWALSGTSADADMTGMSIQALAPYYSFNSKVKTAVDAALTRLSSMQNEDGSFGSVDGKSAESCAQVIVALTALGINPETDARFVKNGISVVDALCGFAVDDGGFKHTAAGSRDGMATEQGYYALTAYMRLLNGKTALYDMSDVALSVGTSSGTGTSGSATQKDNEAAQKVIDLIDAIGKVTADSSDEINAARKAYNALTAAQKKLVTNYDELTEAEADLKEVLKVQNVIDLIEAIGKVTVNSETRIKKARTAYDALTAAQKKLVNNYSTLLVAEVDLNLAKIDYVEELIDSIGTVDANSKTKINRARTAYNKLTAELKAEVTNYDVLVAAEDAYKNLAAATKKTSTTSKKTSSDTTTAVEEDLTTYSLSVNALIESLTADSLEGEILDAILAYEELTEEEKAAIGKDRTIESLKVQFAEIAQIDAKTGIALSGADWNIGVVVEDVLDLTQAMYLQEKLGKNAMLAIWDIYLKDMLTGKEYQPDGSVLVKIPLAQIGDYSAYDGLAVVHFAADGTVEYLNSMIMGEYLVFNTVDFSNYAVVGYYGDAPADGVMTAATNSADAPANMSWIPWTVGGVVGIAALAVLFVMQKKNKRVNIGE